MGKTMVSWQFFPSTSDIQRVNPPLSPGEIRHFMVAKQLPRWPTLHRYAPEGLPGATGDMKIVARSIQLYIIDLIGLL